VSLYRSIASKDDLLVGMMDTLMGEEAWPATPRSTSLDPTTPPKGWRAQLEYIAHRTRLLDGFAALVDGRQHGRSQDA
jgi:hypothetical protein